MENAPHLNGEMLFQELKILWSNLHHRNQGNDSETYYARLCRLAAQESKRSSTFGGMNHEDEPQDAEEPEEREDINTMPSCKTIFDWIQTGFLNSSLPTICVVFRILLTFPLFVASARSEASPN